MGSFVVSFGTYPPHSIKDYNSECDQKYTIKNATGDNHIYSVFILCCFLTNPNTKWSVCLNVHVDNALNSYDKTNFQNGLVYYMDLAILYIQIHLMTLVLLLTCSRSVGKFNPENLEFCS